MSICKRKRCLLKRNFSFLFFSFLFAMFHDIRKIKSEKLERLQMPALLPRQSPGQRTSAFHDPTTFSLETLPSSSFRASSCDLILSVFCVRALMACCSHPHRRGPLWPLCTSPGQTLTLREETQ